MKIQDFGNTQTFSLHNVLVNPARNTINAKGEETRVEPRLMAVLVRLANADGGVVSRETLIDDVWEDDTPNDEALTQAISRLRRAIGDDPRQPHIIETVPKRGYRLMVMPSLCETNSGGAVAIGIEEIAISESSTGWMKTPTAITQLYFLWAAVILLGGIVLYSTFNKPKQELYEVEVLLKP